MQNICQKVLIQSNFTKLLELKYAANFNTHNLVTMNSYAAQRMPVTLVLIENHNLYSF
jgi:hypothetical protein